MELGVGANHGTKVIALFMARRRSVSTRAAGDGNGNKEPTQKDEKTEDPQANPQATLQLQLYFLRMAEKKD